MSIYGHFCCYTNPTFIHDCHLISRLTLVMLNKMPCPLLIFVQSVCMIQVVDTTSNTEWQTVQIQISWLLQKPTDLDLHCLQRQSISGFSRTRVKGKSWLFIKAGLAQLIVFLETDPRRRLCFSSSSFGWSLSVTRLDLITAQTTIGTQSVTSVVLRLQPVYFLSTYL